MRICLLTIFHSSHSLLTGVIWTTSSCSSGLVTPILSFSCDLRKPSLIAYDRIVITTISLTQHIHSSGSSTSSLISTSWTNCACLGLVAPDLNDVIWLTTSRSRRKAIFHHSSPKNEGASGSASSSNKRNSAGTGSPVSTATASGNRRSRDDHALAGQAAPSKAQNAPLAAYNPAPAHTASEAKGFVAQNPAQGGQQQALNSSQNNGNIARVSPGLSAANAANLVNAGNAEDSRAKAERMVHAEREAKRRQPEYEGLPPQFQLDIKMGE